MGIENYYIELIENYPCNNKTELILREQIFVKNMDFSLNMNIPGRTTKEYYRDNLDKILNYQKEYNKIYNILNREKRLNRQKIYEKKMI